MSSQTNPSPSALAIALECARRGLPAFPVHVWWHEREAKWKKSPLITDWPNAATKDPDELRQMFGAIERIEPAVGILTGPRSSLYVVDVDPRNGGTTDGLPPTRTARTISGGTHHYFYSAVPLKGGKLRDGVDFKATGGFVIAAGCPGYEWVDQTVPIAVVPEWVAERSDQIARDGAKPFLEVEDPDNYAIATLEGCAEEVALCPKGGRNTKLNGVAFRLGRFVAGGYLNEDEVVEVLEDAASDAGLGQREATNTIQSGLQDGKQVPLQLVIPADYVPDDDDFCDVEDQDQDEQPKEQQTQSTNEKASGFDTRVKLQADRLRVQEAARLLVEQEKWQESAFEIPKPKTLRERLAEEIPAERCFIESIWPDDGNLYIAAQAGSGKTTFVHNLLRSSVDGVPFLGAYETHPLDGTTVLIDLEMNTELTDLWLWDQGIENQDNLIIWNFRGDPLKFNVTDARISKLWADQLREIQATTVVLDCVTPLLTALGLDENRELRTILYAFYNTLKAAGVRQGAAVHHAGWNGRSRGDSAAVGIGDVNILLDENRNMEITKSRLREYPARLQLNYDPTTRHLTASDQPFVKAKMPKNRQLEADLKTLVEFMRNGHQGLSANNLENICTAIPQKRLRAALDYGLLTTKDILNTGTDNRPKYTTKDQP